MTSRNIELIVVVVATASPFWFMASSWGDLSEAKATGLGVGASAAILAVYRAWQSKGAK